MKVSVVIPAYNEEKYIGKTLDAVNALDKDNFEVEVLVIDGSSTDKTAEIAKSFGARVKHELHKGIGFARQHGLKHATGDIVAFTDADTIVPKDWLTKHVKALSEPGVVCSFGTFKVDSGNFPYYQITNYIQPWRILIGVKLGLYYANGQNITCVRDKALEAGGFDERLELLEDADFVIRMSKIGKVKYLPDCKVLSSGRRSKEGWKFFWRAPIAEFRFFILGKRDFKKFPDYR